jgi:hypothetical protein
LRYGDGTLYTKNAGDLRVFWQGPTIAVYVFHVGYWGSHIGFYDRTNNVSFNGGMGGTTAKATAEQRAAEWEQHIAATPEQTRHVEAAAKDLTLALSRNHGHPAVAATPHAGVFKGPGVVAARLDKPIEAPVSKAPAVSNATRIQGHVGEKPLERQSVKLLAPAPHHAPSPPPPTASNALHTAKPVAQALRSAPQPPATKPPQPTKPQCSPGQQNC